MFGILLVMWFGIVNKRGKHLPCSEMTSLNYLALTNLLKGTGMNLIFLSAG